MLFYRAWKQSSSPALATVIEIANWLACVGLVVSFRLQPSNPYFVLADYGHPHGDGVELVPESDA